MNIFFNLFVDQFLFIRTAGFLNKQPNFFTHFKIATKPIRPYINPQKKQNILTQRWLLFTLIHKMCSKSYIIMSNINLHDLCPKRAFVRNSRYFSTYGNDRMLNFRKQEDLSFFIYLIQMDVCLIHKS